MPKNPHQHDISVKAIIFTEILIIIIVFILSLTELVLSVQLNNEYSTNVNKFFLFVVNNRLSQRTYLGNIAFLNDTNKNCEEGYKKQIFYSINKLQNASLTDVTNTTFFPDLNIDPSGNTLINAQFQGYTYNNFSLNAQAKGVIDLMHRYDFNVWGGYNFCTLHFELDQAFQAFQLIDISTSSCEKTYSKYQKVVKCGDYFNLYSICLILDNLKFSNNGSSVIESQLNSDLTFYCPINFLNINFIQENGKYLLNYNLIKANNSTDPNYIDKYLMINFETLAYFDNSYVVNDALQDYPLQTEELYTYKIGQKNGISSDLTFNVHSYPFLEFYNESMYTNFTVYGENKTQFSFLPQFMQDSSGDNFYLPIDEKFDTDPTKIHLGMYTFPIFKEQCYKKVFLENEVSDFFAYLDKLSLPFFRETSSTLIAWLVVTLFISLWCHMKIRLNILIDVINFRITQADLDSEKITKFTSKAVVAIAYGIIGFAVLSQKNTFYNIRLNIGLVIDNKCFHDFVSQCLKEFSNFINGLDIINSSIINLLMASLSLEFIVLILYFVNDLGNNKITKGDSQMEEELQLKNKEE